MCRQRVMIDRCLTFVMKRHFVVFKHTTLGSNKLLPKMEIEN